MCYIKYSLEVVRTQYFLLRMKEFAGLSRVAWSALRRMKFAPPAPLLLLHCELFVMILSLGFARPASRECPVLVPLLNWVPLKWRVEHHEGRARQLIGCRVFTYKKEPLSWFFLYKKSNTKYWRQPTFPKKEYHRR